MSTASDRIGLRTWLSSASRPAFSAYAILAAFTTYFCMYAFRKPFAAAAYKDMSGLELFGTELSFKGAAVIAQIIGYALSKYVGIKLCSEVGYARRGRVILLLVALAELALLLFALLPGHWKFLALFLNGLPLGMVWGMVFGFLEGRRISELLGAGLSCSYIVASGYVKGVGQWWLDRGMEATWMPFVTGACFALPMLLAVFLLSQLPPPSAADEAARSKRVAMDGRMRSSFLRSNLLGMLPLLLLYFFLTAHRDFRDNFAAELWADMGYGAEPSNFTSSENWITFGVLVGLALLLLVKQHRRAVQAVYALMIIGCALIGVVTLAYQAEQVTGRTFMTVVGLGMYLAYVPFGCVLFDRLQALLGSSGNALFGIYLTDALGYTGSVSVMLFKDFGKAELSFLEFFESFSLLTSILCVVCFLLSLLGFLRVAR